MAMYTNAELADMYFIYGLADGNGRNVQRLYQQRYPTRCYPNRKTFEGIHRRLREHGTFQTATFNSGRPRSTRTADVEQAILDAIERNPGTSTRGIAAILGNVTRSMVWNVFCMSNFCTHIMYSVFKPYYQRIFLNDMRSASGSYMRMPILTLFLQCCLRMRHSSPEMGLLISTINTSGHENPYEIVPSRH